MSQEQEREENTKREWNRLRGLEYDYTQLKQKLARLEAADHIVNAAARADLPIDTLIASIGGTHLKTKRWGETGDGEDGGWQAEAHSANCVLSSAWGETEAQAKQRLTIQLVALAQLRLASGYGLFKVKPKDEASETNGASAVEHVSIEEQIDAMREVSGGWESTPPPPPPAALGLDAQLGSLDLSDQEKAAVEFLQDETMASSKAQLVCSALIRMQVRARAFREAAITYEGFLAAIAKNITRALGHA